ncbi:unnamed protein product [Bursaphelenchus okinawaensis]|uniref:tRNA-splicing endonuclease subunit Sen54 N-terminal domain-containing protein n=1 Tax=Bursaphelenchus okinawaensis TaxID=465554 RepID=A0A811KSL9_9BILA|nr:unnamed protein product [Bursaphelenchus okinawaensis]CAG9111710.1 unnamed protein product [Bursaphelenchus okinawaensis]
MTNIIRSKRKSEYLLLELDTTKRRIKVIQPKTSHLSKMGYIEDKSHFLLIEEAIYLVQIGAAAVLTPNSSCPCSLSQLMAALPLFESSLQRYSAFFSLYRNGFTVIRKEDDNCTFYELRKDGSPKDVYYMVFDSSSIPADRPRHKFLVSSGSTATPQFRFVTTDHTFDPQAVSVLR